MRDNLLNHMLDKLNYSDDEKKLFESDQIIDKPSYDVKNNVLSLHVHLTKAWPFSEYDVLLSKLKRYLHCKVALLLEIDDCSNLTASDLHNYIGLLIKKAPELSLFVQYYPIKKEDQFVYEVENDDVIEKMQKLLPQLEGKLEELGIKVGFKIDKYIHEEKVITFSEKKVVPKETSKPIKPANNRRLATKDYPFFRIKDLDEGMNQVKIHGKIFAIDERITKTNKLIQTLHITDGEEAIIMIRFENKQMTPDVMRMVKENDYVEAFGNVEYDSYRREKVFKPRVIDVVEEKRKQDLSVDKRVEFHVHTKLSEMDGVSTIQDYINQAVAWGHKAITLLDHNVAQAYPAAQKLMKKINVDRDEKDYFKVIYGVELNMLDPTLKLITNPDDRLIKKARYCVFDLEATGLSAKYDEIIEFGGVILEEGLVVERLQMFIKPKKPISAHISELTHITNEDVKDADSIEEALPKILKFIENSVLVAHNAEYDMGMLNAALINCGYEPYQGCYIDTLDLAKFLLTDRRFYSLGNIARSYKVAYDSDVAHRADYDAEVLSEVFTHLQKELEKKEMLKLSDIPCYTKAPNRSAIREKHISVIAKNDAGIKDIFELISIAHTDGLCEKVKGVYIPKIDRETIETYRQKGNILLGSCCQNGEVFDVAKIKRDDVLAKTIEFYDYIEVQPPENYINLVNSKNINDQERLLDIIKTIIELGKKANKIVIASGDAHYVEEEKHIIRDIYINAKAIGGMRHPLYQRSLADRKKYPSPKQHFRTTDEMLECFAFLGEDLAREIVIDNTNLLNDQIDFVYPIKDTLYPPEIDGAREKLTNLCYDKAKSMYGDPLPELVANRLQKELDSIIGNGYEVVYYISHLLVKQSNDDGYLVGSRGSVGSSFAATMASITEVNPLEPHYYCPNCQYSEFDQPIEYQSGFDLPPKKCPKCGADLIGDGQNIPFETFLGFEGDKIPDIDLNFSGEYQGKAHKYLQDVFGAENAFRAGTIGTVADKTAFGYVKGYEEEMDCIGEISNPMKMYLASQAAGVRRTTSQHPGGIVVFPSHKDASDVTPVQYPANDPNEDMRTTHLDYHEIEQNVLKFDILGHVDPTAMKMLEEISGIDVRTIPMNDPETMKLFSSCDPLKINSERNQEKTGAAGLPEFGTAFVRGILEDTCPTTFDELLKISGLSHGTDVWLNNAKDLIDEGIVNLKQVIGCRDDIMVYLLQKGLKPKLAFTIMESVRKGRGLKDEWIDEMKANGVDDWYIESCKKIKYMFPKAHAVAYVMMAVRIAWFKVHKPLHYYCQFFSIRCDSYDVEAMINGEESIRNRMSEIQRRLNNPETKNSVTKKEKDIYNCLELALEMVLRGYHFSKIDINKSEATRFSIDPDHPDTNIIPSFTSVDGLGENVAISIVKAREDGPFISKQDLLKRTGLNETLLKKLDDMGALGDMQAENQLSLF